MLGALAHADQNGARRVGLETVPGLMDPAIALYRRHGFRQDASPALVRVDGAIVMTLESDGGTAVTAADDPTAGAPALARYLRLYAADDEDVEALVAEVFARDARFESDGLASAVVGHEAIAHHVRSIRAVLARATVHRVTEVQWSHRTARWCWRWVGPSGTRRGMDVARLTAAGDRIELLTVFSGLLPPPGSSSVSAGFDPGLRTRRTRGVSRWRWRGIPE